MVVLLPRLTLPNRPPERGAKQSGYVAPMVAPRCRSFPLPLSLRFTRWTLAPRCLEGDGPPLNGNRSGAPPSLSTLSVSPSAVWLAPYSPLVYHPALLN